MVSEAEDLERLKGAILVAGGLRSVAAKAEVDPSNLSKLLRTGMGLSQSKLLEVERVLGRPGGHTNPDQVIILRPTRADSALGQALSWYMPNGAQVARASWSGLAWENIKKMAVLDFTPSVYALRSDDRDRMIIILEAGLFLRGEWFGDKPPYLRWYGGDRQRAVLGLGDEIEPWLTGDVSPALFDSAWPDQDWNATAEDLLEHVRRLGISWSEAIRRTTFNAPDSE